MLQSMGLQRIGHNLATEQQQQQKLVSFSSDHFCQETTKYLLILKVQSWMYREVITYSNITDLKLINSTCIKGLWRFI